MGRLGRISTIACALFAAATGRAVASEIWVAPTYQADIGGLGIGSNGVWPVTAVGAVRLAWGVPEDLETFTSARLVLIPHAPGGAAALNLFVCAARSGDMVAAACTGPHTQPFTGIANQLLEVDVSAAIAPQVGLAGVNHLAVIAYTTPTTATDHIVGLRFAYDAAAPDGVATLGTNTFTGTQTAPAFVGDGSGLTNVPLPAGAATLGANVFTGTQTAPAFVGDGSGLTNLPFPAGAATLGANTFTGTQTIDGGSIDLDPSTAATGNITKNGVVFLHDYGGGLNTFLGNHAGNFSLTGVFVTATGAFALHSNTTGAHNTANGANALHFNTTGERNTATGSGALLENTTGESNTGHGASALLLNTTGSRNTASGHAALLNNISGHSNVAAGFRAGVNATTGSNNIYLGADVQGIAGESNTMYLGRVGTQTKTLIAGVRGTAVAGGEMVLVDANGQLGSGPIGPAASSVGTNEVINDSLTASDLAPNSVGTSEVAFNYAASASEGGAATDVACTACIAASEVSFLFATLGENSFGAAQTINNGSLTLNNGNLDLDPSTSTTGLILRNGVRFLHNIGTANTFLGENAGALINSGFNNTATGTGALQADDFGFYNTAHGAFALTGNTEGHSNTAVGGDALLTNRSGDFNTAVGRDAMRFNAVGSENTAVGEHALFNTTGSRNVAVGRNAGVAATIGSNNIYLGANVQGVAGESNTMYLGSHGVQTRTFISGVRGVTTTFSTAIPVLIDPFGQLGTVSSSRRFKEDIHDIADESRRLMQLRPVTFRYSRPYGDGSKPRQFGLIAEEVAEVFPELAVFDADGRPETVQYHTLNVLLLNELQRQHRAFTEQEDELRQQRRLNEAQQQRIEQLERRLEELLRRTAMAADAVNHR